MNDSYAKMESLEIRPPAKEQSNAKHVTEKDPTADAEAATDKDAVLQSPAPDGGLRAWLVVCGATFILFTGLGYSNSFGVILEYYMTHQLSDRSPDDISWIGSTAAFLLLFTGAIGGPLFDRYGAWIMRPAAVGFVFSLMMISLCTQYWQFMLVQGIILGSFSGLLTFPAMAAVLQYFDKKKGAALGLSISGSSIGGVVMPILISRLLNRTSLGFGWTFRILGFISLPLLAFSCFAITSRLPPRPTKFFLPEAFKERRYVLLIISAFFVFIGMWAPLFYLPAYAVSQGMSSTMAGYILAIINGASTFGRVIPGVLADKFGRLNVFSLGSVSTAVVLFCWTQATSSAGLVVYSVMIGFTTGSIISGLTVALSDCTTNTQSMGTFIGMGMALSSISVLIGPPINGALLDTAGGYANLSYFSGSVCLLGGAIAFASKAATPKGLWGRV